MKYLAQFAVMLLLAGCSSPQSRDAAFRDVAATVTARTNKDIHWDSGTDADRAVRDRVAAMLQRRLTVDDAVQIALLNNRNLQATYEDIGIAQAELVQAGLLKNPVLTAEIRFPAHPRSPLEIDVFQEFLSLLYMPMRKRLAGAAFEAAKLRVTEAVLDTVAETKSAYYTAQAAQQAVEMRQRVVQATEASAEAAKRLHDAGNMTDLELANEQVADNEALLGLADAEADAADAGEGLNRIMGLGESPTAWAIAARLPDVPEQDFADDSLESLALNNRVDLAAARQDIEVMGQGLGLLRSSALIPELQVGSHFEREPDGVSTFGPSIEIPIPIFDQGKAAVSGGQARLRQSQQRYAALAVAIYSDVRRTRNRTNAAAKRARHMAQSVLPLRHQITEQTLLEYNGMLVGVFDLLRAKQAEIDAGRQYIDSLRAYWLARTELEHAVGGSLNPPQAPATTEPAATQPVSTEPESPEHPHQHHGG